MTRPRSRSFQVESLEGKQLLSTLHAGHQHPAPKPTALVLDGSLSGLLSQKVVTSNFKASTVHTEEAVSGSIKSLGRVQANIIIDTKFTLSGPNLTHNEIVLQGTKGNVTLTYGPNFVSEKVMPNGQTYVYRYTVVSGTGAYSGASGTGTVTWTDTGSGWGFSTDKVTLKLHSTH